MEWQISQWKSFTSWLKRSVMTAIRGANLMSIIGSELGGSLNQQSTFGVVWPFARCSKSTLQSWVNAWPLKYQSFLVEWNTRTHAHTHIYILVIRRYENTHVTFLLSMKANYYHFVRGWEKINSNNCKCSDRHTWQPIPHVGNRSGEEMNLQRLLLAQSALR